MTPTTQIRRLKDVSQLTDKSEEGILLLPHVSYICPRVKVACPVTMCEESSDWEFVQQENQSAAEKIRESCWASWYYVWKVSVDTITEMAVNHR